MTGVLHGSAGRFHIIGNKQANRPSEPLGIPAGLLQPWPTQAGATGWRRHPTGLKGSAFHQHGRVFIDLGEVLG
jgi:hypothetical protein